MQDVPLGNNWQGLNRRTAKHLLTEGESPDTLDAGLFNDTYGLLGPRRGRVQVYNRTTRIVGVVPLNIPEGRFRIVATTNGTVHAEPVPWPAPLTPGPCECGYDEIQMNGLTAAQTNVGETFGTAISVGTFNLEQYSSIVVAKPTTGRLTCVDRDITVTAGFIALQLKIGGVWTDFYQMRHTDGFGEYVKTFDIPMAGNLTHVRAQSNISGGTGDLGVEINMSLYLLRGSQSSLLVVP